MDDLFDGVDEFEIEGVFEEIAAGAGLAAALAGVARVLVAAIAGEVGREEDIRKSDEEEAPANPEDDKQVAWTPSAQVGSVSKHHTEASEASCE